MDNLCHTLAGLAIGETGLKRKSALASATLMIGANLPDVDGFIYWLKPEAAFGFRRGWTHGILAMAVWPLVLAGAMLLIGRLFRKRPDPRGLLVLSAISIWSHPLLDLMNTYGVRLLMPFSERWFYLDTLFIIDPWILLALTAGILMARRAQRPLSARPFRPARIAVACIGVYVALMATLGARGRRVVRSQLSAEGADVSRMMVGPLPLTPFERFAVADIFDSYLTATVSWLGGVRDIARHDRWPAPDGLAAARAAAATPQGRVFLSWARFPVYRVGPTGDCADGFVCISDLRYAGQGWAEVAIPVARTLSSPASPRVPEP